MTVASQRDSFELKKRSQLVVGSHNEALSVIAVRVSNSHRSPAVGIFMG
jgi:hypothetical protein